MGTETCEANHSGKCCRVVDERDTDRVNWLKALLQGYNRVCLFYFSIRYNCTHPQLARSFPCFFSILFTLMEKRTKGRAVAFCSSCFWSQIHLAKRRSSFPYYHGDVMDCAFNETAVRPLSMWDYYREIMT